MSLLSGCPRVNRSGPALLFLGAFVLVFTACDSSTSPDTVREVDGPAVTVGQGTAQTFVITLADQPTSIGVRLSATALDGLPTSDTEWELALPTAVTVQPWNHVMLDWNPQGHPPDVYGVPHFDFHFYDISTAAQAAIAGGPDTVTVPAANVPRDYASGVMSVPNMGVHWVDTLAAEFHGRPFDKTYIYGFSMGSLVFVEPMVTRALLASQPDVSAAVKQPQAFQTSGMYPRSWSVRVDQASKSISVALDSLTAR